MLNFTGDICLCDNAFDMGYGVGSFISKNKIKPFVHLAMSENDVWIGNFEGVLSDVTNRNDYTKDSFRISFKTFEKCGSIIDYWGIANNHVMEHGNDAYQQMEFILSKESKGTFGSAKHRSIQFELESKKIALTGFSLRVEEGDLSPLYWHLPELSEIQDEIKKLNEADYKIVYVHWGVEYVNYPYLEQMRLAHWLIDIGYDMIIGMHPHVLQGFEVYHGKFIFYSLGNTVFNMNYPQSRYGAIVSLDVKDGKVSYRYTYINDDFSPVYIDEDLVPESLRFNRLNRIIGQVNNVEKYVSDYCQGLKSYRRSNYLSIAKNIFNISPTIFLQIFWGFVKRRF